MKLKFDSELDFQAQAVASVVDLFIGQQSSQTTFTVGTVDPQSQIQLLETSLGIGNRILLRDQDLLLNLNRIQYRHGLKPSTTLDSLNFTIEMETGTGKTYVYLRSIYALNQRYGFTKFIIVVPSIAIKEGVYKSLQITEDHLKNLYDNVRCDFFVYDSQKLGLVRNFATSDCIQIMVINIDAFRRSFTDPSKESKANIIHRAHDRMMGAKPIDFIRDACPIVIIDEPQSVDTTAKSAEAIASLNPLCTFRYSATHIDKHHPIFRLDAVDAYQRKLVKQIEVAGITEHNRHNQTYVRLVSVNNQHGISARIELDMNRKGTLKRAIKTIKNGVDLYELSGGRALYDGYIIDDIYCGVGEEYIRFTNDQHVRLGQTIGGVDQDEYKRLQIKTTIIEHLRKEQRLRPKGIKVLSLFFIDRVANYRAYDQHGTPQAGKYARFFEEEYASAIRQLGCAEAEAGVGVQAVHDGYFSIDKKGNRAGAARLKDTNGKTAADQDTYQLIMRDKERLLSFESKLKFIFSHSALREGWDNPNVFQICTLNETTSELKKRQEIGRGLRIAVNQNGERVHDEGINTLTVMANESYEVFTRKLQQEIEADTGIRFGQVEPQHFAAVTVGWADQTPLLLGIDRAKALWNDLKDRGYIDHQGTITDTLKAALHTNTLVLAKEFAELAAPITTLLKKVASGLPIKNLDKRTPIRLNKERFLSEDFKALWEQIKYQTTFRVEFDPDALIDKCAAKINSELYIPKAHFVYTKATADLSRAGVSAKVVQTRTEALEEQPHTLPDILSLLQNQTNLTRRSLVKILCDSDRLSLFKRNPQKFIEQVGQIIKTTMEMFIVDGIKYDRIGDNAFYCQQLFETNELFGYLQNLVEVNKSIYEQVVVDSEGERRFAMDLNASEEVKVFAKLPSWFKIDTPLGRYNPDWAVLIKPDDPSTERLFFVVETKAGLSPQNLRESEKAKLSCGNSHFEALGTKVKFIATEHSFDSFRNWFR